jgi:hypothetical protein
MAKVTFPITITGPGPYNPFSQAFGPEVTSVHTAEVDSADIVGLFPTTEAVVPAPLLSASELATKYTTAELMAALQIALTPKA